MDPSTASYLDQLTAGAAAGLGDRLVGSYAHGSLALGGYRPAASDIDVLVVVESELTDGELSRLAADLCDLPCPAVGLELSVVTRGAAATPVPRPRYELHVTTAPGDSKVLDGRTRLGDPDLVLHFAVCRASGIGVAGAPAPAEVFAEVPRALVLSQLADEMTWAAEHNPTEYAVLNACRALRYTADGALVSKVDGGRWALLHLGPRDQPLVAAALALQTGAGSDVALDPDVVRAFMATARDVIRDKA